MIERKTLLSEVSESVIGRLKMDYYQTRHGSRDRHIESRTDAGNLGLREAPSPTDKAMLKDVDFVFYVLVCVTDDRTLKTT